jgi:hypothetical protein
MTDYQGLTSYTPATTFTPNTSSQWSLGTEFYVTQAGMSVRGMWYYRPSTTATATPVGAIWQVDGSGLTGSMVPETYIGFNVGTSVTGWVYQAFPNPVPITANQRYRAVIYVGQSVFSYTSNFWTTGGTGASGITSGPLVYPNAQSAQGGSSSNLMQGSSLISSAGGTNPGQNSFTYQVSTSQLWPVDVTVTDVPYSSPVEVNPHLSRNPAWTNTSSTPINATALENLETLADGDHPFRQFRTNHFRIDKVENVSVSPQTEYTVLDTLGPGVVRYLWFATGGNVGSLDCRLRIYYDGSSTTAMDIDLGTLYAMHWGAGSQSGTHQTQHMHAEMNSANYNAAYTMKFPIPFGNRIRITYYNPNTSTTVNLYSMAYYNYDAVDRANGIRLRCQGIRYADQVTTYSYANPVQLANITSGPGWVAWLSQVGGINVTNNSGTNYLSWMERNLCVQLDGETVQGASLVTTGTEDTFDSSWYFEGWRDFSAGPDSYVGTDQLGASGSANQYAVGMATDYIGKFGGIYFNSSCNMTFQPEPACQTSDQRVWSVLYYN